MKTILAAVVLVVASSAAAETVCNPAVIRSVRLDEFSNPIPEIESEFLGQYCSDLTGSRIRVSIRISGGPTAVSPPLRFCFNGTALCAKSGDEEWYVTPSQATVTFINDRRAVSAIITGGAK